MRVSVANEAAMAAVRTAPPVAVIWASMAGWGPQEWMYALTTVYVALQIAHLGWRWLREIRRGRNA